MHLGMHKDVTLAVEQRRLNTLIDGLVLNYLRSQWFLLLSCLILLEVSNDLFAWRYLLSLSRSEASQYRQVRI